MVTILDRRGESVKTIGILLTLLVAQITAHIECGRVVGRNFADEMLPYEAGFTLPVITAVVCRLTSHEEQAIGIARVCLIRFPIREALIETTIRAMPRPIGLG